MLNRVFEKNQCDKCDDVTNEVGRYNSHKSDVARRLERFATLVTRIDFEGVTCSFADVHTCHTSHMQNSDVPKNKCNDHATKVWLILSRWLKVMFDEGHIEPSQPSSGKSIGWPTIRIPLRFLWIDFNCWFRRHNYSKYDLIEENEFYAVLDKIFVREDDKYQFPPLRTCNLRYKALKVMYECV